MAYLKTAFPLLQIGMIRKSTWMKDLLLRQVFMGNKVHKCNLQSKEKAIIQMLTSHEIIRNTIHTLSPAKNFRLPRNSEICAIIPGSLSKQSPLSLACEMINPPLVNFLLILPWLVNKLWRYSQSWDCSRDQPSHCANHKVGVQTYRHELALAQRFPLNEKIQAIRGLSTLFTDSYFEDFNIKSVFFQCRKSSNWRAP